MVSLRAVLSRNSDRGWRQSQGGREAARQRTKNLLNTFLILQETNKHTLFIDNYY